MVPSVYQLFQSSACVNTYFHIMIQYSGTPLIRSPMGQTKLAVLPGQGQILWRMGRNNKYTIHRNRTSWTTVLFLTKNRNVDIVYRNCKSYFNPLAKAGE